MLIVVRSRGYPAAETYETCSVHDASIEEDVQVHNSGISPSPAQVGLYTSNTAAILAASGLKSNIHSVADLRGRVVGTPTEFLGYLADEGVVAIGRDMSVQF